MNTDKHEVLVLGDGDFSYSTSLISSSSKCSLTSTVFLSKEEILSTYGNDATNLPPLLCSRQYDSIHFNFPHTGGKGKISENRKLLIGLFNSLQKVVKDSGNVEVALLPGQGGTQADGQALRSKGNNWNIQEAAATSGFILYSVENFGADFYNLTGYRGRSKAFFCDSGLRHKFKVQPFKSSSLTEALKSAQPYSYIQKYLNDYSLSSQSLSYRCSNNLGNFDELFSIYVDTDENEYMRSSKRAKIEHQETVDTHILKHAGLQSKKLIFYPANQTKVLYPPFIKHDVSMWTTSADSPNIVPVLLECVGLALHQVTKREPEPFFSPKTEKYSHCFSITYSHPFEALSEEYVKYLAHVTVRDCLARSGFDLH
ncbi:hypothetical protein ACHWQZ_G012954 [Mnemiopsis leidyi]